MKYIPSAKLNKTPIKIIITSVGQYALFQHPQAHRQFIWNKLAGSGVNRNESNHIADAIRQGRIVFVGNRGYINGVLVETPTQHVTFDVEKPSLLDTQRGDLTPAEARWADPEADYERHP